MINNKLIKTENIDNRVLSGVLFETAKKTWFLERIIPTLYFYTFKENEIFFRVTHISGKCPNRFVMELKQIIVADNEKIQIFMESPFEIDFDNHVNDFLDSEVCIKYRFPTPGLYFITFNILDNNCESITDDKIQIEPFQKTFTEGIGRAWSYKIESSKPEYQTGKIPIIVLDYFSYQITKLTKWLIGLTIALVFFPKTPEHLIKLIIDFFKNIVK